MEPERVQPAVLVPARPPQAPTHRAPVRARSPNELIAALWRMHGRPTVLTPAEVAAVLTADLGQDLAESSPPLGAHLGGPVMFDPGDG